MFVGHQVGLQQLAPRCTSSSLCNMQLDEVEWGVYLPRQDLVHEHGALLDSIATNCGDHYSISQGSDSASSDQRLHEHEGSLKTFKTNSDHDSKHSDSYSSAEQLCAGHISVQLRPRRYDVISGISSNHEILYEHLFYKIVTPSDVGKLNRLVIPKQNAERYFPLHPYNRKRGLLLCFRDHNLGAFGKLWWFRYSYWSSSQSYVLTKGWIRFVNEKNLKPGDIISFERGITHDEFYISCRRKPSVNHEAAVLPSKDLARPQATNSSFHYSTPDHFFATNTCSGLQNYTTETIRPDLPAYRPKLPAEVLTKRELNKSARSPYRSDMMQASEYYTSCKRDHDCSLTKRSPWEDQGEVTNRQASDPLNSVSAMRLFGVDLRF